MENAQNRTAPKRAGNKRRIALIGIAVGIAALCLSFGSCKKLEGIAITANPDKMAYEKGEELDLKGMVVTAAYDDGTTREITGYKITRFDPNTLGPQALTITFKKKTATLNLQVGLIGMIWVPAGTLTSKQPYGNHRTSEKKVDEGFFIGRYEVTQEQWEAVMGAGDNNPSKFREAVAGEDGTPGKLPVENVSWYQAIAYCNKLSLMELLTPAYEVKGVDDWAALAFSDIPKRYTGAWNRAKIVEGANGYRLPTGIQWEYAARAGADTNYSPDWDAKTPDTAPGWYRENSDKKTHKVGLKAPNAWGIYDTMGNVWEWCWGIVMSWGDTLMSPSRGGCFDTRVSGYYEGGTVFFLEPGWSSEDSPNTQDDYTGFRVVRPGEQKNEEK